MAQMGAAERLLDLATRKGFTSEEGHTGEGRAAAKRAEDRLAVRGDLPEWVPRTGPVQCYPAGARR